MEHAKRNAEKRFKGGHQKVVRNFIEFSAFTSPGVFTVSVDLFLENLLEGQQDTVYLSGRGFHLREWVLECIVAFIFLGMFARVFSVRAASC